MVNNTHIRHFKHIVLVLIILFSTSCASNNIQRGQRQIRENLEINNAYKAMESVEISREKGWYSQKDAVLYNLELGTTSHFSELHKKSMAAFESAKDGIDKLVTRSASRAVASVIGNDNQLDYDGSDIEHLYINTINALNYLSTNDLNGALVETKQMSFKLEQLTRKFGEAVDQEWLKEQNESINWDSPSIKERLGSKRARIRNSAWARYLSTIIYAKNGLRDDARIESDLLKGALGIQQDLAWGDLPFEEDINNLIDPNSYNVLVVAFTGASPIKSEAAYRDLIPIQRNGRIENIYIKYALPVINFVPTTAAYVDMVTVIDNVELKYRLPLIEHLDEMQMAFFDEKTAIIYVRAIARGTAKIIGTEALKSAVREKDDDDKKDETEQLAAEAIAGIFSFLIKEATENADLRSWQSLPAKVHATTLLLPPGEHQVYFQFFDVNEQRIFTQKKTMVIPQADISKQLIFEDALFWN